MQHRPAGTYQRLRFGQLTIDPKKLSEMKLVALKGGKKKVLIDLLHKRFNSKSQDSPVALATLPQ